MAKRKGTVITSFTIILYLMFFYIRTNAQLVMDANAYKPIIEAVHNIFNNTCVILFYTVERPMQALDPYDAEQLMSIQQHMSRLHVRTFAYAIKTFKESIGESYFTLKRPLFILINDSEEMRQQFSVEIAPWIAMAYINWVVFFRPETKPEVFFSEIYVPMDCIFLIVRKIEGSDDIKLMEVYNIAKDRESIISDYGTWNENDGLMITKLALYQRRSDLQGQLIRIGSVEDPPISLLQYDNKGQMTGIKGFFGTIIQILQENMNFTVSYTSCDSWGLLEPNGSWTGIVGKLVRKEIDFAATELIMTADRLNAIQFTTPVFSSKCRIYIKRPYYTAIKWTAYSDPFYSGIWICLLILITLASLFILIGYKVTLKKKNFNEEESHLSFSDSFFFIFGAMCGQGHESVTIDSIRLMNLVIHITGVIILAAYSAALISILAIKVFVMPFTTMEGLLNDGSYKFSVVRDSADYAFFQMTSDKTMQRMFDEALDNKDPLPINYLEGLVNVCQKDKHAFMTMDNMFAILEHQIPCILEPLNVIMQTTMAMGVQKRSAYRGIINNNILLMGDSGILQRIVATELLVQSAIVKDHWVSVEIVDVLPLMLLIILGVLTGVAFLIFEKIIYSKFKNNFKNTLYHKILDCKIFK